MRHRHALTLALVVPLLLAAACTDTTSPTAPVVRGPVAPLQSPVPGVPITSLGCTASVDAGRQWTVRCGAPGERAPGVASDVIFGGQNEFVRLEGSNNALIGNPGDAVPDTLGLDVTVTNLIPQALGTTDGALPSPTGIRVFFSSGPTANNGGTVTVLPDGVGTFTATNQPYYQYGGPLPQDSTTAAKRWRFELAPGVAAFTFTVLISTDVQYPNGYILNTPYVLALNPGETRALPGSVRTFLGEVAADQTIAWASSAPGVAAVSGTQVTAGGARGITELTATAGGGTIPAIYTTAVSVCEATVVTHGTSLPSSISDTDCFSTFGSSNGRPTTSYYGDLYRVALTAGQTITIELDSGDELDTYLLLADPVLGTLIAGNDDDDEGELGVGSRLVYTASTTGIHVIEASTFNGLDTGNYTLRISIQ